MKVKDKKLRRSQLIYERLALTWAKGRVEGEKGLKFESFGTFHEMEQYEGLLVSAFDFDRSIPEREATSIVKKALGEFMYRRGSERMYSAFKKSIEKYTNEYLTRKRQNYMIVTNLSIQGSFRIGPRRIPGDQAVPPASIHLSPRLPRRVASGLSELDATIERQFGIHRPNDWWCARIGVAALSEWAALQAAYLSLDFVRGIWNMYVNPQAVKTLMGRQLPINRIATGPIVTVHDKEGEYIPNSNECHLNRPKLSAFTMKDHLKVFSFENMMKRRLCKVKYASDIVNGIAWLARALDNLEYDQLFLSLWGVLEYLVNTDKEGGRQTETVNRAVALSTDREYETEVLNAARDFRNGFAHKFYSVNECQSVAYGLKWMVERIIYYHVFEGRQFETMSEACDALECMSEASRDLKRFNRRHHTMKESVKIRKRHKLK